MDTTDTNKTEVGIIGAGCAGAMAAHVLRNRSIGVTVYEKSRGHGGRASTRYLENGRLISLDHGAQYFTIKSQTMEPYLETWLREGLAAEWKIKPAVIENGEVVERKPGPRRYVGTPTMNAPIKQLLDDVPCQFTTEVRALSYNDERWQFILDDGRTASHRYVICTTPPAQAADLVENELPERTSWLRNQRFRPTWCYGAVLEKVPDVDFQAGFVNDDSPADWIACNRSKPGRNDIETWILHADHGWSDKHLEEDQATVRSILRDHFREIIGDSSVDILDDFVHRWRFAKPAEPRDEGIVMENRVLFAGDWIHGSRVEGALLSGKEAGEELGRRINIDP